MRQRGEWMKPADDTILEYINDAGEVPPAVVARNVEIHSKYAGKRCRELAEFGLLDRMDDGYYSITEAGEAYLAGELDANKLEK